MTGEALDPISLNAYAYANANPLAFIDPTGLDAESNDRDETACEKVTGFVDLIGCQKIALTNPAFEMDVVGVPLPNGGFVVLAMSARSGKSAPGGGGGGAGKTRRWDVDGGTATAETALRSAEAWLGPGYRETKPGVYRSADGTRQFRMTSRDLRGAHGSLGPHVHFEAIASDGRTIVENSHVKLR